MLLETSDVLKDVTAVFLTGVAVKLLDDYLDRAIDPERQEPSLAAALGSSLLPYALVIFALASALSARLASSLMMASYVVGMARDPHQRFPLGLTALGESLIVGVAGISLLGFMEMASSFSIIFAVQLFDDFLDYLDDQRLGMQNFVRIIGRGETLLLGMLATLGGLILDPRKAILVLAMTPVVCFLVSRLRLGSEKPYDN